MKLSKEIIFSLIKNPHLDSRQLNIIGTCPFCGREDYFGVSLYKEKQPWGCYSTKCGERSKNIFWLLKKLNRLDLMGGVEKIFINSKLENKIRVSNIDNLELSLPCRSLPIGFKRSFDDQYLIGRGFTERDFNYYKVGRTSLLSKLKDYVIVPIEEGGINFGYVARNIKSKKEIDTYNEIAKKNGKPQIMRYRNDTTDFSKLLYGFDRLTNNTRTVIIVEGVFDAFNVTRILNLYEREDTRCLVTFGAKISPEQIFKMQSKGIENIILLFDNDALKKSKEHSINLSKYFNVKVGFFEGEKDAGDINEEELYSILDRLQDPISFSIGKVLKRELK